MLTGKRKEIKKLQAAAPRQQTIESAAQHRAQGGQSAGSEVVREFPIVGRLRAHVKSASSDAESDGTPVNVSQIIADYFPAGTKLGVLVCTRPEVFKAAAVEKVGALEYWGSHLTWFESYITKNGLEGSLSELVSAKATLSISKILKSAIDERVFGRLAARMW